MNTDEMNTANASTESAPGGDGGRGMNSTLKAIATDLHFWVPVAVLIAGLALLFLLK